MNGREFLSFWTTFPGVIAGAAVIMVGTGVLIVALYERPGPAGAPSCTEFQRGREERVACNANTSPGFFWSLVAKTEHYSVGGVSPVGEELRCGPDAVGRQAMSARFPLDDAAFLPVRAAYENNQHELTSPGCNVGEAGVEMTDRDLGAICGLFTFKCSKQPL